MNLGPPGYRRCPPGGDAPLTVGSPLTRGERLAGAWFGPKGFASVIYGLLALQSGIPDASWCSTS